MTTPPHEKNFPPDPPPDLNDRGFRDLLFSGVGFYRMSKRRRRQLSVLFGIALGAHILGLVIFGGIVMLRERPSEPPAFKPAPPLRTYEPRTIEHRVKVQQRQRSSSRPSMVPRVVSMRPSNLALPEIKADPRIINTTFQPKFKPVSGMGIGAGLGSGYGVSGFGEGVSSLNFFGIQARGERIAILVDVSVSMVEEQRGGVPGFMRVKQRVGEVVDTLRDGTLFNVIAFDVAAQPLEPKMVYANEETRRKAKRFIEPFNVDSNWGLDVGDIMRSNTGVPAQGGSTRLDLALYAAFSQHADTILIFSDGLPLTRHAISTEQRQAYAQTLDRWNEQAAGQIAAFERDAANAPVRRVWVPPQPARPPAKGPPREGQPIDRGAPAREGYWREVHDIGRSRPAPPPAPEPKLWTFADFVKHIELLHAEYYAERGAPIPVIHSIGYIIDREGGQFLQQLARHYKGQYRHVRSLR